MQNDIEFLTGEKVFSICIYKSEDFLYGFTGCESDDYESELDALIAAFNMYGSEATYYFNV